MSVYTGFKHYVCDRCGREAYIAAGSAEEQSWSTVHRVSADKATDSNPVTNYTFCYQCRTAYNEFDKPQDTEFNNWMGQPARDRAAAQAAVDLKAKQDAEAEKTARQKEIDDAVARAKAEQKAEDEKNMIAVPTVPDKPATGTDTGSDTGSDSTKDAATTPGTGETGSGSAEEDD